LVLTLSLWSGGSNLEVAIGGDVDRPIATRHAKLLEAWHAEQYEAIPGVGEPARSIAMEAAPARQPRLAFVEPGA
jgi:hypothetical protein